MNKKTNKLNSQNGHISFLLWEYKPHQPQRCKEKGKVNIYIRRSCLCCIAICTFAAVGIRVFLGAGIYGYAVKKNSHFTENNNNNNNNNNNTNTVLFLYFKM